MTLTLDGHPDRDVRTYRAGDFVATGELYGIVVDGIVGSDSISICSFPDGLPFAVYKMPQYGGVRKVSRDEARASFYTTAEELEREIENGGLAGAIAARKKHALDGFLFLLDKTEIGPYSAATRNIPVPNTGLYVLMGVYAGQGPSEHLDSIVSVPILDEIDVSQAMIKIKPHGFGNIPSDVYNTPATSHGSLVAYWTYEVPERARHLVPNPKKLERNDSRWVFTETFSDGKEVITSMPQN